ncbi:unnamed protein product [Closterium sp. NIES-53]
MHNSASRANCLRATARVRTAVFYGATLDSRSAAALAHRRRAVLAGHLSAVLARLLYATLAGGRPCCAWATEHPSRPASPRLVRNKGGVDDEVDGGARVSDSEGTKQKGLIKVNGGIDRIQARVQQLTAAAGSSRADVDGRHRSPLQSGGGLSATTHMTAGKIAPAYGYFKFSPDRITVAPLQGRRDLFTRRESIEPQLEVAGLKGFADGTVPILPADNVKLRGEFHAAHLLTFMVISRCCSPVVQLALRSCQERLDACHQAWHFILSTYQVKDDLHIGQLEEEMTHIRMASYITHIVKGLLHSYNLMKRMMIVPGTRESLDEDSITNFIPQHEAMQETEQPTEPFPQGSYAAPTKQNRQLGQCGKPGGGGSGGGRSTKDVDEKRSTAGEGPMSGCFHHLMGTKAIFVDMAPSADVKHMRGFNGALQPVEGHGTVTLQVEAGKRVLIPDVLYVPGVQANLLSAGKLKESRVQLQSDGVEMLLVVATGKLHARLAHAGVDTIKSSAKHEVAIRLNIKPSTGADPACVSGIEGKLARHTFLDKGSDAEEALAVVHIDLCGPFGVAAKDGSLNFQPLKDRHTRFVWVMLVAKKSDVLREFQKWLVLVERQAKKLVLMLRSDRGGEFLGKEFTDFVDGKGIVHDLTCPYTPQQNGMAEREMRTVVESMRTMLLHMGMQHHWWHLALRQAVWVRNCLEWLTTPPGTTPYQLLTGKKPDLTLARVWGCMVQFMVPEQQRGGSWRQKLTKGFTWACCRRWHRRRSTRRQACRSGWKQQTGEPVEQEAAVGVQSTREQQTGQSTRELSKSTGGEQSVEGSKQLVDNVAVNKEGELSSGEMSTDSNVVEVPIEKPELQRTGPTRKPPERLVFHACLPPAAFTTVYDEVDDDLLYDDVEDDVDLPELDPDVYADPEHRWDIATMTVKEAHARWKGKAVKAAMEKEIRSLIGMGTWELVEHPCGGFTQVYGADYDETYSPVSSYVTPRIFLSIVAVLNLNLMQLDMKNTFLQSKLDRVLYMYQLDFFDDGTGRKSQVDTALYFKASDDRVTCWLLVYVDDLLTASSSPAMLKELKDLLEATFKLREISPVQKYLRLEIVHDKPARKLWPHQQNYADKLRMRFIDKEQGGRVPKTPVSVDAYAELTFDDEEAQEPEEEEYRQKVGSLQFAATTTRSDIAFAYSKLGSGLTVRSDQHWREVDRCLAYLADIRDTTLEFGGGSESLEMIGYKDADDNESEYVVATDAGKEGCRLHFHLAEFKHMEQRYAWLQHMVRRGKFVVKYIPTTEQPADFPTKALPFPAFNRCSIAIGQVRLADVDDSNDDVQQ